MCKRTTESELTLSLEIRNTNHFRLPLSENVHSHVSGESVKRMDEGNEVNVPFL